MPQKSKTKSDQETIRYKNGRPAQIGDRIAAIDDGGHRTTLLVIGVSRNCKEGNIRVVPRDVPSIWLTARQCVHVDDAMP